MTHEWHKNNNASSLSAYNAFDTKEGKLLLQRFLSVSKEI